MWNDRNVKEIQLYVENSNNVLDVITNEVSLTSDNIAYTPNGSVPAGGTQGQYLRKKSSVDYDSEWSTPNFVTHDEYAPVSKTDSMTQAVGKDVDGKLWTEPSSGGGSWSEITNKPFESIDTNTLKVENNVLKVFTTDNAEMDNTKPITSSGVQVIVGNINVLLSQI